MKKIKILRILLAVAVVCEVLMDIAVIALDKDAWFGGLGRLSCVALFWMRRHTWGLTVLTVLWAVTMPVGLLLISSEWSVGIAMIAVFGGATWCSAKLRELIRVNTNDTILSDGTCQQK